MPGCKPQIFPDISLETLICLQARGAAAGLPISGNSGQATAMGVTFHWLYDETALTLLVECTNVPFFIPCSTVSTRITELVEGCRPQNV